MACEDNTVDSLSTETNLLDNHMILSVHNIDIKEENRSDDYLEIEDTKIQVQDSINQKAEYIKRETIDDDWGGKLELDRSSKVKSDQKHDEDLDCNSADYKGFCSKLSTLAHILNNNTPRSSTDWKIKTIPSDILEIRDTSGGRKVYALKNLPENVILGPFEGVSPIEKSDECVWGFKNGKLSNMENGNWMQYINCAASASTNNLDVFQFEGTLYYQTSREIDEGEELLVYYREEEIQISDNNEVDCFIPMLVRESQKVFACTLCCLGFKLEEGLIKHKVKCSHVVNNGNNIPVIIKCPHCNIWLEKEEHLKHHFSFCQNNCSRLCKYPTVSDRAKANVSTNIKKHSTGHIMNKHSEEMEKRHKCTECSFQTNNKTYLTIHIMNKHCTKMEKRHKCAECPFQTNYKSDLTKHILNKHSEGIDKRHKCTECSYKTNHKANLTKHIMSQHTVGMEKLYKCTGCSYQTINKSHLTRHIMNKHSVGVEKRNKCTECSFQTNYKSDLTRHIMNKHGVGMEKRHKCTKCAYETNVTSNLTVHIINKHSVGMEKPHKCTECSYETTMKSALRVHIMNNHRMGKEKLFKCAQCSLQTNTKNHLIIHILDKHSVGMEKRHKCTECSYQTNAKGNLTRHILNKHNI